MFDIYATRLFEDLPRSDENLKKSILYYEKTERLSLGAAVAFENQAAVRVVSQL